MKILPTSDKWTYMGSLSGGMDIKGYLQIKEEKEIKWKTGVFLMIEKDGLLVPFEVKDVYFKNDIPYIKLHLFPVQEIKKWKNAKVFAEKKLFYKIKKTSSLVGYELYDAHTGYYIGNIQELHEFSLNKILRVTNSDNKEFLIPFHEDLVYKQTDKKIYLKIPEGLIF